jgi:hypothetical protein
MGISPLGAESGDVLSATSRCWNNLPSHVLERKLPGRAVVAGMAIGALLCGRAVHDVFNDSRSSERRRASTSVCFSSLHDMREDVPPT